MTTVKYRVVKCDECNHEFKFKPKIVKTKKIVNRVTGNIIRHYFLCPKCKHMYVVMYQDQEYKDNLKEMEIIRQKASELRIDDERYLRLLEQHDWFYNRNMNISKKYKQTYGS